MDDRLERLLQELTVAINESVSTSQQIRGVIAQSWKGGYIAVPHSHNRDHKARRRGDELADLDECEN